VRVLPITDDNLEYAGRVAAALEDAGFRVEVEDRSWTIGRKIQATHEDRVPYMLIVGDDEEGSGTVAVRDRKERERQGVDPGEFRAHLVEERDEKRVEPEFLAEQD
jgi:threonyl-tRNA synthetase